jgi:uridine kinase
MQKAARPNPSIAELAAAALVSTARCGRTRVILIDGPAGSGKTTLANRLAVAWGGAASGGAGTYDPHNPTPDGAPVQILHSDDMYEGWDGLRTLDQVLVGQVLEPLSRGGAGGFAMWDWLRDERTHVIGVPQRMYLVIEGVGVAQRAARTYASLVIYVDAPWPERLARGVARDGESMRAQWEVWQCAEEEFLNAEGTLQASDIVVDGLAPVPDAW